MEVGIKGHHEFIVEKEMLATQRGSGAAEVFASPVMIAEMERTAAASVKPFLKEGEITVGTHLDIQHTGATPEGERVYIDTELVEIKQNGKILTFKTEARNDLGVIGHGMHDRAIVNHERFIEKLNEKFKK